MNFIYSKSRAPVAIGDSLHPKGQQNFWTIRQIDEHGFWMNLPSDEQSPWACFSAEQIGAERTEDRRAESKTDYEKWLEQMDQHQPDWWLEFAQPSELVARFYAMKYGQTLPNKSTSESMKDTEKRLRNIVGQRLFVCIRAWVALPTCPICQEPVVLAKRLSAERGAPLRVEETSK